MILLRTSGFNPPSCNLSSVQAGERWCDGIFVFASLDFHISCSEDDFDVARVTLVGVDTTVGTVCATAGFLQHNELLRTIVLQSTIGLKRTGACCTTILLMMRSSTSMLLASAFDSAFFSKRVMNLTDFSGHRPTCPNAIQYPYSLAETK
jgi:hypothetical protein